jgi:hypothetical protein
LETDNFQVVSCAMAICEGHLLVISKKHLNSMAELSENQYQELTFLQEKCKKILFDIWGEKAICCEHGTGVTAAAQEKTSSSIRHAHRHIAFIDNDVAIEMIREAEMKNINGYEDLQKDLDQSYIWYEDKNGKQYYTNKTMRKQFLRGAMAKNTPVENDFVWQYAKPETLELFTKNQKATESKIQKYLQKGLVDQNRVQGYFFKLLL